MYQTPAPPVSPFQEAGGPAPSGPTGTSRLISYLGYLACIAVFMWMLFFGAACVVLKMTDAPPVHTACGGFWEFMVVSLLSPILVPLAYLLMGLGTIRWQDFYLVSTVILTVAAVYMTLMAAGRSACVNALTEATPNEPWLLVLGWLKIAAYTAASLSALYARTSATTSCNWFA